MKSDEIQTAFEKKVTQIMEAEARLRHASICHRLSVGLKIYGSQVTTLARTTNELERQAIDLATDLQKALIEERKATR